jgi:hypothetical protein
MATATRRKVAAKPVAEPEENLLDDMESPEPDDDDESLDLLDEITEDDGRAWYPWEDEEHPQGVQVTVTTVDKVSRDSDYVKPGDDPYAPFIQGEDSEGTLWSFRGYSTVMARQMQKQIDAGLKAGDLFAVKYLGEFHKNAPAVKDKKGDYPKGTYHNVKSAARIK